MNPTGLGLAFERIETSFASLFALEGEGLAERAARRRCLDALEEWALQRVPKPQARRRDAIGCAGCGNIRVHVAKGLCSTCYSKTRPAKACVHCSALSHTRRYGLCVACYARARRAGGRSCP